MHGHRNPRSALIFVALSALLLVAGCGSDSSAPDDLTKAAEAIDGGDIRRGIVLLKSALQKDPDLTEARRRLGGAYLIAGTFAGAEKEFERLARSPNALPSDPLNLAEAQFHLGKHEAIIELLKDEPESAAVLVLRARAYRGESEIETAAALLDRAIELDPNYVAAYKHRARLAWARGDIEGAARDLEKVAELEPNGIETWLMKGEFAASQGNSEDALAYFDKALTLNPYNLSRYARSVHFAAAQLLLNAERPEDAKPHIDAMGLMHPRDPLYLHFDGRYDFQRGDYKKAETKLREVLKTNSRHAPSLFMLGAIARELGNLAQAEEYLSDAVAAHPENVYAQHLLSVTYLNAARYEDAIKLLERVVELLPEDAYTWTLLGTAYMHNGDRDLATKALTRASELNPESADILSRLAASFLANGSNDQALAQISKAIEADPAYSQAGYIRAIALLQNEQYDQVIAVADELIESDPENPVPYNLKAAAHKALGNLDIARELFEKSAKRDPAYVTPRVNLVKLDLEAGDLDAAQRGYESILAQKPDDVDALVGLGKLLIFRGAVDKGVDKLEAARRWHRGNVESRLFLAKIYSTRGRNSDALAVVEEALKYQPSNLAALTMQSGALLALGRLDEALNAARKLDELDPDEPRGKFQLAKIRIAMGELEAARDLLLGVVRKHPDVADAKITLSNLERQMGVDPSDALTAGHPDADAENIVDSLLEVRRLLAAGKFDTAQEIAEGIVARKPTSTDALVVLGSVHAVKGNAAEAQAAFEKIRELDPDSNAAELNLASLALQQGDAEKAKRHYKTVLGRDRDHLIANVEMASLVDPEAALGYLERALAAHPDALPAILKRAQLHLNLAQWNDALKWSEEGLKRAPASETLMVIGAQAAVNAGKLKDAERLVNRLLQVNPKSGRGWFYRAQVNEARNRIDDARVALTRAAEYEPDNPEIDIRLAAIEFRSGEFKRCLEILTPALERDPENATGWTLMGDANWRLERQPVALENYARAHEISGTNASLVKLAKATWTAGNRDAGKQLMRRWLDEHPDDGAVRYYLGDMMIDEQDWSAAAAEFEALLERFPRNPSATSKLAVVYAAADDPRADKMLDEAYKLDGENPEVLTAYGWKTVNGGLLQEGTDILARAIDRYGPDISTEQQATARFRLAIAHLKNGNKRAAREHLEKLLAATVAFPDRGRAEQVLSTLK